MPAPSRIREVGSDGVAYEVATPASQPGDIFPPGVILQYAGAAAPANWAIADGSVVARTGAYAALFAAIGTTYGAGDGSTTFSLPDLRDKVPVGKSGTKALGSTGGAATVALAISEMPSHNHAGVTQPNSTGITLQADGAHTHNVIFDIHDTTSAGTGRVAGRPIAVDGASSFTGALALTAGSHVHGVSDPSHQHAIQSQGGGLAHNNLPPYLAVNHIIKL